MATAGTPLVDDVQKEINYGTTAAKKRKPGDDRLPNELNAKNVDGKSKTVRVLPKTAMFGFAEPPGGWTGPFGFLRLVAIAFLFLSAIMFLSFFYALFEKDNVTSLAFCLLLAFASILAAAAAYSHEGLANQVSKMARHNNEYSELNDNFEGQTKGLEKVAARIEELLGGQEEKLEEFKKQMAELDQLSSLNQVSTLTRSFIDAQMKQKLNDPSQDLDGILTGGEVIDFLRGAKATLQEQLPGYDLNDLAKAAYFPGMCLMDLELLLAAVITENDEEKACFMGLLYFFLHPRKPGTIQEVTRALKIHLKDDKKWGNEQELTAEIARCAKTTPEAPVDKDSKHEHERIPPKEAKTLARAALHTFQEDRDEDLGVSDDED